VGFVVDKVALGQFLQVLRFPLPIFIPPITPQSSSIIRGWYNRPVVAAVPSGLSLTPLRIIKKNVGYMNLHIYIKEVLNHPQPMLLP
jgi:hypothetical protein